MRVVSHIGVKFVKQASNLQLVGCLQSESMESSHRLLLILVVVCADLLRLACTKSEFVEVHPV